jgi:hypothetical protein
MTPEERLAYLRETVFVPVNMPVLITDVTNTVGLEAGALVVGTLKAAAAQNPLFESVLIAMSSVGLYINTAERQGQIDQLAAAGEWPNELRDAVKSLGGRNRPRWQTEGYEFEPTIEQITDELTREETRNWWIAKRAQIDEGLFDETLTTIAEVRSIIGGD